MYNVAVLYDGETYNRYVNLVKLEEQKENINIVGVGVENLYANRLDSWRLESIENILLAHWDYLLVAGAEQNFLQIKSMLKSIGICEEKILSITIFSIPCFDFKEYIELYEKNISIISSNCWGGFTYHALKMRFLPPFLNLYLSNKDYLKMLEKLDYYLKQDVVFEGEEWDENLGKAFPVGRISDVKLYFNHYESFEEAKEKWVERRSRINRNNLFVEMFTSSHEDAERFDRLPYKNKVVFVPFTCDLNSAVNIGMYNNLIDGNVEAKLYENVNRLGRNQISCYNVLRLLNGKNDFIRVI